MALSIRDCTIIKVVQTAHHQGDVRYSTSRGIPCSCIYLMIVAWTSFKSPDLLDKFDLDYRLCEDLRKQLVVEKSSINIENLETKRRRFTAAVCLYKLQSL